MYLKNIEKIGKNLIKLPDDRIEKSNNQMLLIFLVMIRILKCDVDYVIDVTICYNQRRSII